MNPTELNATNLVKNTTPAETQKAEVTKSSVGGVNVSAAYSYLSVLTREQGNLGDELARAQANLQRHIATLATDPERAQNANPVPTEKPLLDLTTRVILRDIDLQEQIANDLTSRVEVVKTADAVDKFRSYCDTLPRVFQESNDSGKALMRYMCELVVNKTTADNISPATSRQLALEQIFPPDSELTPKAEQILNKLIGATVEFIRANQPDVIASMGREASQVLLPTSTRSQMAEFIETAMADMPEDFTYLDIFANKNNNFDDETSEVIAKRVGDIIIRAASTAREAHLLDETSETTEKGATVEAESEKSPMEITVRELSKRSAEVQNAIDNEQQLQEKRKNSKRESIDSLAKQILEESKPVKDADGIAENTIKSTTSSNNVANSENESKAHQDTAAERDRSLLSEAVRKSIEDAIVQGEENSDTSEATDEQINTNSVKPSVNLDNIDLIDEYENFSLPASNKQGAPLAEGDEERIKYILSTAVATAQQSNLLDTSLAQKANAQVQPTISRAVEQTMKNVLLEGDSSTTVKVDDLKPNEAIVIENTDDILLDEASAPKVNVSELVHVEEPEILQPELLTDETAQTVLPNVNLEDDIEISHDPKTAESSALNVSIFAGDKSLGGADIVTRIVTEVDPNSAKKQKAESLIEQTAKKEMLNNAFPPSPRNESKVDKANVKSDALSSHTVHIPASISLDDSNPEAEEGVEAKFKPFFVGDYKNSAYSENEGNQEVMAAEDSLSNEYFQVTAQAESMMNAKAPSTTGEAVNSASINTQNNSEADATKQIEPSKANPMADIEKVAQQSLANNEAVEATENTKQGEAKVLTQEKPVDSDIHSSAAWVKGISKKATLNVEKLVPDDDAVLPKNISVINDEKIPEIEIKPTFLNKITKFFGGKNNVANSQSTELESSNVDLKNLSMDEMLRGLSKVVNDGKVTPEIRKMASSIHQAMTNPLGDLQSVAEWLGLVNAPLSATGPRAQAMQQWALMLLSIRFKQLGKNIDKFTHTEQFKQLLQNASLGDDKAWPQNSLNHTLQQIERLQNLSSTSSDYPMPTFVPLPPSYEGGREGAMMVEHQKNGDDAIEWRLNFFFELAELGPMQIRTSLKVPDLKINVVTEKLNAIQKVKETMGTLTKRLSDYGFNVAPISARMGTVYPPVSRSEAEVNKSSSNDGLSLKI